MARPSLDRILATLGQQNPDVLSAPITETAPQIADAAAEGAKQLIATERENAIASTVRGWYSAARSARAIIEQQWNKNLDMYAGRQFTEWSKTQQRMVPTANPGGEPRTVVNIIEPMVRTEMAKTGSTHPSATVSPGSDDQDDLMAAMAAERAWEWFYDTNDFHTTTFTPANFWRTVCGNGFGKTYWDAGSADPAQQEAATAQYKEQQASQAAAGIAVPLPAPRPVLGQIRTKPVSPFHLFVPDLTELSIQDQPYVLHAYTIQTATAKLTYGALRGPDWNPAAEVKDVLLNPQKIGVAGEANTSKKTVQVIEAWVKPGMVSELPAGGLVVLVGNDIVGFVDHFPYDHGQYPFFHLPGIETGGFYRKSIVETVTPLQDQTNRTVNQQIKNRNFVTAPQWLYDEGSVDPNKVRPRAGMWIPVRLGMKDPRPVAHTPLPAWIAQFTQTLDKYRDDISGQHQVSRATSPGSDTAASALSLLREVDDDFLVTVFDGIRVAMTQTCRQVIGLMVQFWDEPRLIRTVGKEEAADAKMIRGADLAGGTDIKIDGDSMLPQSKTAKIATITDWMDKGWVPPALGLDVLEMGQLGKAYKMLKTDQNAARRENVALGKIDLQQIVEHSNQAAQAAVLEQAQGVVAGAQAQDAGGASMPPAAPTEPDSILPVHWYDEHQVHVYEHKQFAKSQEFETWEPERQEQLRLHVAAHERELAAMMPPAPVGPDGQPVQEPSGGQYADGATQPTPAQA